MQRQQTGNSTHHSMHSNQSDARSTHNSFYSNDPNNLTQNQLGMGGERVKVAVRLRPLQQHELQRNDKSVIQTMDNTHVHLTLKGATK